MSFSEEQKNSKRKYSKISLEKRLKLISLVDEQFYPLNKAAKRLHLNSSTARLIYKNYKENGTFPMKKFKEQPPKTRQQPIALVVPQKSTSKMEKPEEDSLAVEDVVENQLPLASAPPMYTQFCMWPHPMFGFYHMMF